MLYHVKLYSWTMEKLSFLTFHDGKFNFSAMTILVFVTWKNILLDHGKYFLFLLFLMTNLIWYHGKKNCTMANYILGPWQTYFCISSSFSFLSNHGKLLFSKLFLWTMAILSCTSLQFIEQTRVNLFLVPTQIS